MKLSKAFTLVEILVVLTLLSVTFSTLLLVFSRGIDSSLNLFSESQKLRSEVLLFWDMERKVLGAKRIKIENDRLYMITSAGSLYEGVVKCAYFLKEGKLYYYEFPYPYGPIDDIEEDKAYEIGLFKEFSIRAIVNSREEVSFDGLPQYVEIIADGRKFLLETIR